MHCNVNPIYVFPEKKLCGLSPTVHIHVSVSDLYIPRIGPHNSYSRIGRPFVGIYKSLTDTWMNKTHIYLKSKFATLFFDVSTVCLILVFIFLRNNYSFPCWCYVFWSYGAQLCSVGGAHIGTNSASSHNWCGSLFRSPIQVAWERVFYFSMMITSLSKRGSTVL